MKTANTSTLEAALRHLVNEVRALAPWETEIRAAIGNTNWACMQRRLQDAEAALAKGQA
jgi:hypothetical protein